MMPKRKVRAEPTDEYDSPWKEAVERFFPDFCHFFFPEIAERIDWNRGFRFLDSELRQVVRDADTGPMRVDKLVEVYEKGSDAETIQLFLHMDVQSQREKQFVLRMFQYYYRLFDKYGASVISVAVLADDDPKWRPEEYHLERLGFRISVHFPTVKLLNFRDRWEELEASSNPFAAVVMAHLQTQATKRQPRVRMEWKLRLVKGLYEKGLSREHVLEMFRLIDWMMRLPEELEQGFKQEVDRYEEARVARYVTSVERLAKQEGQEQGLREAILDLVRDRFGEAPQPVAEAVGRISDYEQLKGLNRLAARAGSLDEFLRPLGLQS